MRGRLVLLAAVAAAHLLPVAASAQGEVPTPPGQVPLDDVWCTVCHWEQGDQFAVSVHYQKGLVLCNDCHGGNPFESHPKKAKALETGFIGKPKREDIEGICGKCHTGPAAFFDQGPHHDPANPDNPTCITCHHNHSVLDATLALMDTSCTACHADQPESLRRGTAIQALLREGTDRLHAVRVRYDSLRVHDPGLARSAPLVQAAESALRGTEPRTHTLDLDVVGEAISGFGQELGVVQEALDESETSRRHRHWAVLGVWLFVAVNVAMLWVRRHQL